LFLAATVFAGRNFFQVCDDDDAVAGMAGVYHSGAGFPGTSEYAPPGAENALVASGLPDACLVSDQAVVLGAVPNGADPDAAIPAWNAGQGSCDTTLSWQLDEPEHKRIRGVAHHAGFLIPRLRSYPAWRVQVNGQPAASLPRRADGLMAVPVAEGPVDLTVDWTTTPDAIAGRCLSGLAVLVLTGFWLWERKLNRPRLS
jgi:hypothetical protein